jgi:signal transduction histidine kinase
MLEQPKSGGGLPEEHFEVIRKVATERRAAAGEEVFREGDAGDGLYLLAEGAVEICVSIEKGGKQVLARIGPGEVFGEMAVIEEQDVPRSAGAVALVESRLFFCTREAFLRVIQGTPELGLSLTRLISKRLREANRQYVREVLQAERLSVLGRFTRAIMHDLKNPLNLIGLTAEVAGLPEATPEMRRKASADIRQQVEKITTLIAEVLEFATAPARGQVIPAAMSYREFMRGLVEEFREQAAQHNIGLECDPDVMNLPATMLSLNPRRLQRAFCNLFVNALEAMPEGGRIMVRAWVKEAGNGGGSGRDETGKTSRTAQVGTPGIEVITEVEDTGPGLPAGMLQHVFEPFATEGKPFGTGLGLSIARRIVEDHGGWIRYRSEPGKGAIFAIGLPGVPPPAEADPSSGLAPGKRELSRADT